MNKLLQRKSAFDAVTERSGQEQTQGLATLICITAALFIALPVLRAAAKPEERAAATDKTLVCATYPIYLFTKTVVGEHHSVKVELLVPAGSGCPHDYVLTTADMRKLEKADAVLLNGLGLDDFLRKPLQATFSEAVLIETAAGMPDLLPRRATDGFSHARGHDCHDHHAGDKHERHYNENAPVFNPHLFASPRRAAGLLLNIAAELAAFDPGGADTYRANARRASRRLEKLADEMEQTAETFKHRKIVVHHDIFDYLAEDLGLQVVAVILPDPGLHPSATQLRQLMATIRDSGAAALIAEPQFEGRVPGLLSRETGIPKALLDPVAGGPADAALDHYEKAMRNNIAILRTLLQ